MVLLTTFLFLSLSGFTSPARQSDLVFTSAKQTIEYGQETTLIWKASKAQSVFISGIGGVSTQGNKVVQPKTSTEYILIAQNASSISVVRLTINVKGGQRGDDDYPTNLERFKYPIKFVKPASSLPEQLSQIHSILQDDMKFSVKEFQTEEGFFFLTNSSQRDYLIHNFEPRIRARYISYLVKVGSPQGNESQMPIVISSMIEYVRGGESTRRLETMDTLYRNEAERLRVKISGGR